MPLQSSWDSRNILPEVSWPHNSLSRGSAVLQLQCPYVPAGGSVKQKRPFLPRNQRRRREPSYFRVYADASLFCHYTDVSGLLA
ncbi:hypothetical protein F2P81_017361 [Scophthalmus maximus]|uniref:Uncharacterized protein n=1 Tax=Scophthalmus maximus TaxID=52904 RepID=A0A6A4SFJ5_SCOMX|nr:hypothetical protein F2P81_017361 [Scophthalmus maximus]